MATDKPGIRFQETMAGWFAPGEGDPKKGQQKGQEAGTLLTIRPLVTIDNFDAFQFDTQHAGRLESTLHFPPLFGSAEPRGSGIFNLFVPSGNTKLKYMKYAFSFRHEGEDYYFFGQKGVEDDPGFDLWKDTTTLFSTLHKGKDRSGPVIGAGVLRINLPGFVRQLMSMRVINCHSTPQKVETYLTFANFFIGQLRDTYLKKWSQ